MLSLIFYVSFFDTLTQEVSYKNTGESWEKLQLKIILFVFTVLQEMQYLLNKVVTSVPSHLKSHQDKWSLLTVSIVLYPDSIHCGVLEWSIENVTFSRKSTLMLFRLMAKGIYNSLEKRYNRFWKSLEAFGKPLEFFNLLLKVLEKLFKALEKVAQILHQKRLKRWEKLLEFCSLLGRL